MNFAKLKYIIEPAQNIEELDLYLNRVLNIELPWDTVDEMSTSSPLKFVWSVYDTLLHGRPTDPHRFVTAASRNSTKTLTSSIIQYLSLLHFRRDSVQIAATLNQSGQAIAYIDKFVQAHEELLVYKQKDNVRKKAFINLPPNDYTTRSYATLQVVTATKKGANAPRASLLIYDEVDLTDPAILSEAAMIADPAVRYFPDGSTERRDPVSIYLSSRKSNDGPIQKLIEQAESSDAKRKRVSLHKWSVADMMEQCKPEVHKPELGPITAYMNPDTLETIWPNKQHQLSEEAKLRFKEIKAWKGCEVCPAWLACQGRSVKQQGTSSILRAPSFVGQILDDTGDSNTIIAQLLNWKPETTGIVFKAFNRHTHVKGPRDFYEFVTNGKLYLPNNLTVEEVAEIETDGTHEEIDLITPSKEILYKAMIDNGWNVGAGVDWGYDPDPAVCVVAGYHRKRNACAVLHIEASDPKNGIIYANHSWAEHVSTRIHPRFPFEFVAPDQADPSSTTFFAKYGVKSLDRKQKPKRIVTGVSFIRGMHFNPTTNTSQFAILDDYETENNNIMMIEAMEKWTHARDPLGRYMFDKFADDKYTHSIDALRYYLHPYTKERAMRISVGSDMEGATIRDLSDMARAGNIAAAEKMKEINTLENAMKEHFQNEFGINIDPKPKSPEFNNKNSTIKFSF